MFTVNERMAFGARHQLYLESRRGSYGVCVDSRVPEFSYTKAYQQLIYGRVASCARQDNGKATKEQ